MNEQELSDRLRAIESRLDRIEQSRLIRLPITTIAWGCALGVFVLSLFLYLLVMFFSVNG